MAVVWTRPRFLRSQIDAAGGVLRELGHGELDSADGVTRVAQAYDVLDNWRASHAFPLNTMQMVLRGRARDVDSHALVAQRLKRSFSVIRKLHKQKSMRLSQMQDIGGCRAVVNGLRALRSLHTAYSRGSSASTLVGRKDYIQTPSSSGYRSIHLIYEYHTKRGKHLTAFDGLQIEIQLRSQLQHAWATAVETVGAVTGHALKVSEGPREWLNALTNISSLFAYVEGTPPAAGAPDRKSLARLVSSEVTRLRIRERLKSFGLAVRTLAGQRRKEHRYFLLVLDATAESLSVVGYREAEFEVASSQYRASEDIARLTPGMDVVLVRAESIEAIERAYPNYFLDSQFFISQLNQAINT